MIAQSGLYPSNCRLLHHDEALLSGSGDGSRAILVLGFESGDHDPAPSLERALEICREHAERAARGRRARGRRSRAGAARSCAGRTSATRWRGSDSSTRRSRPRSPGRGSGSSTSASCARCGAPCRTRAAPERSRAASPTSIRTGPRRTTRSTRRAGPAQSSSSGTRSRPRPQRRSSPAAARSPITIRSAAITGRGTGAEVPQLFQDALRAAKHELDPAGIMNPGVLLPAGSSILPA